MTDQQEAAAAGLRAAEASQDGLVRDIRTPRGHYVITALSYAGVIGCWAIYWPMIDGGFTAARVVVVAALVLMGTVAEVYKKRRFMELNGMQLHEFAYGSRRFRDGVLPLWIGRVLGYGLGIVGAIQAAEANRWGLVILIAVAGGCVVALMNRQWLQVYRAGQGDVVA